MRAHRQEENSALDPHNEDLSDTGEENVSLFWIFAHTQFIVCLRTGKSRALVLLLREL
jgi:hypothetical protein